MQFNRHFINRIEKQDVLRLLLALAGKWMDAAGDADDRSGRGAGERI